MPSGEWLKIEAKLPTPIQESAWVEFRNVSEATKKKLEGLVDAGTYHADKDP